VREELVTRLVELEHKDVLPSEGEFLTSLNMLTYTVVDSIHKGAPDHTCPISKAMVVQGAVRQAQGSVEMGTKIPQLGSRSRGPSTPGPQGHKEGIHILDRKCEDHSLGWIPEHAGREIGLDSSQICIQ